ncbi:hypothetical protein GCM10028818_60240 [Spirosoma horti]
MSQTSTYPAPGVYQYAYPTSVDTPQLICVHFVTPDQQHAFVSYPKHPNHKGAQLVALSWFASVRLVKQAGQPQLMPFLEVTLRGWLQKSWIVDPAEVLSIGFNATAAAGQLAA